jgi:hypothetical protein
MSSQAALSPALLHAIIAASIHAAYGSRLRIICIGPLIDADWAREGRRDIFMSHRFR